VQVQQNFFADQNPLSCDGFEQFWNLYPRKVGKLAAQRAWTKARPINGLTEVILGALAEHKKLEQWQNPRLIPHAQTWLHQRRWEDDVSGEPKALEFLEEP